MNPLVVPSLGRLLVVDSFVEVGHVVSRGPGPVQRVDRVGVVIGGQRQEIFRSVTVEPLASLSRLETVLVMTSFVPIKLSLP